MPNTRKWRIFSKRVASGVEDAFNLQLKRHREGAKGDDVSRWNFASESIVRNYEISPLTMTYFISPVNFFKGKHHGYRRPFNGITDLPRGKKKEIPSRC